MKDLYKLNEGELSWEQNMRNMKREAGFEDLDSSFSEAEEAELAKAEKHRAKLDKFASITGPAAVKSGKITQEQYDKVVDSIDLFLGVIDNNLDDMIEASEAPEGEYFIDDPLELTMHPEKKNITGIADKVRAHVYERDLPESTFRMSYYDAYVKKYGSDKGILDDLYIIYHGMLDHSEETYDSVSKLSPNPYLSIRACFDAYNRLFSAHRNETRRRIKAAKRAARGSKA